MYRIDPDNRLVRDPRAQYRAAGDEPERFPAELVLRDLRAATDPAATSHILARYAVLRAWILAGDRHAEPELVAHARAAAFAHLRSASTTWRERPTLRRLLRDGPRRDVVPLLTGVAEAAEAEGHYAGALAARSAAWSDAVRRLRFSEAGAVADGIAAMMRRFGDSEECANWDAVARRLEQAAPDWEPPSLS